jgi:alkylated DNA repair dioxygenase AlkB
LRSCDMAPLGLFDSVGPTSLLPDGDARATYIPQFVDEGADELMHELGARLRWDRPEIRMFGKATPLPREVAWVADEGVSYRYSGVSSGVQPWIDSLEALRVRVEEETGKRFNSVLVNRYRNGRDGVAWHADDEPELGPLPTIASVSLGAERRFQLRHKETRQTVEVRLGPGSLLIMSGTCQRDWIHQVPRESKVMETRINLTFRWIHPG